jgi:dye decolorizing peroxidase
MLTKDARQFAAVRSVQRGFRPAWGSCPDGTTMRNLMGQVDGTVNAPAGSSEFAETVWARGPAWFAGGSVLVLRRIRMNLETWDSFDRAGKELVVGRRLDTGAPLTGHLEHDVADLTAVDANGFPVIDDLAHVRLAHATRSAEKMLRRGFNYDEGPLADGTADVGLLFAAYQSDGDASSVSVQRRLEGKDALNRWLTHVGSAVFALPPGCAEGGVVGEGLLVG